MANGEQHPLDPDYFIHQYNAVPKPRSFKTPEGLTQKLVTRGMAFYANLGSSLDLSDEALEFLMTTKMLRVSTPYEEEQYGISYNHEYWLSDVQRLATIQRRPIGHGEQEVYFTKSLLGGQAISLLREMHHIEGIIGGTR